MHTHLGIVEHWEKMEQMFLQCIIWLGMNTGSYYFIVQLIYTFIAVRVLLLMLNKNF